MKYTLNTKNILKASIALSAVVLFGCAQNSGDEWTNSYDNYQDESQIVNSGIADEIVLLDKETFLSDDQGTEEPCIKTDVKSDTRHLISASTPAEPRVVPVKPADKCVVCKTAKSEKTEKSSVSQATKEVTVKHKPEVAPTPEVEPVAPVEEAKQEVIPAKQIEPDFPVIETTIDNETTEAKVDNGEEFVIIDETVDEKIVTDVQADEPIVTDVQADEPIVTDVSADETVEAIPSADDQAKRLAEEQEAERLRLQKEMERLAAEKKALEEEKIRITQIQRTTSESCEDVKDWVATEGTTLRSLLMDWGDRVGWRVVWNMDRDYTLEAGAVFRGRFVDVAAALIRSFARAVPAPKGVFYKGNKVLVVSTREDENAD